MYDPAMDETEEHTRNHKASLVSPPQGTTPVTPTIMDVPSQRQVILASFELQEEYGIVSDIIQVMRHKESTQYLRVDYLRQQPSLGSVLDASWRQRIMEWMYGVVDHCHLKRDSVATAAMYLDLVAQAGIITSRQEYQLAAMTCLQIAIKLCDSTVVKLQSMVALGRGLFSEQDVLTMERTVLGALNWNVHPPTPVCFLRQFLRLLPPHLDSLTRYMIAEVTRFISEISVCLYKFVPFPPSVLAYCGMLLAMDRMEPETLSESDRHLILQQLETFAGLSTKDFVVNQATLQLQVSLEKNVSLQELLESIGAQSRDQGKQYGNGAYNNLSQQQVMLHSPRDVVALR